MTSGDICKQGACTFDGLVVTRKFAKENPAFMVALVKAIAKADADYKANPGKRGPATTRQGEGGRQVVGRQGRGRCRTSMELYGFPSLQEQASPTWLGGGANGAAAKALTQQANFLKEQGRLTVGRARTTRSP